MTDRNRGYNYVLRILNPELDINAVHKTTAFSFENLMPFAYMKLRSYLVLANSKLPRKKSYDIARCRGVFLSQIPLCFNCRFLLKFIYFFVAREIICLYSIRL